MKPDLSESQTQNEIRATEELQSGAGASQHIPVEWNETTIEQKQSLLQTKTSTPENNVFDINTIEHTPANRITELLTQLGLESKTLSLSDLLNISTETLQHKSPDSPQDIPGYFLRNLMMVNSEARNLKLKPTKKQNQSELRRLDFLSQDRSCESEYHPLDIIVSIFLCADPFLQQELMVKMSLCQFALPLLLPAGNKGCIFLLWALRSIVKKWCPLSLRDSAGFKETNMVTTNIPMFSFIRLGSCSISKSMILNKVLSRSQQHHNFFIHADMECGNLSRRISDGLVELCWYLPSGSVDLDLFPEPMTILNLRGDAKVLHTQVQFLTNISSAVFLWIDNVDNDTSKILKSLTQCPASIYIVLTGNSVSSETEQHLNELIDSSVLKEEQILARVMRNNAEFTEALQSILRQVLVRTYQEITSQGLRSLEKLAKIARVKGIVIDEDEKLCSLGKARSESIYNYIEGKAINQFKSESMSFQGHTWQQISKIEKEQCRPKNREEKSVQVYCNDLEEEKSKLQKQQRAKGISADMKRFIAALTHSDERKYMLQWMKFGLDSKSRETLSVLHDKYKALYEKSQEQSQQKDSTTNKLLQQLDQQITANALGLEHFMREIGLIYETLIKQEYHNKEESRLVQMLPDIVANLLLDGFPLELVDGDVSNIPLQWVTDVLKAVEVRISRETSVIGRETKVFVLTVLGVQSTGKSTLLNTMFGLQFAVSSGRCTRGAFMQLIKITGDLQKELGCGYIMVIDTEGLKAPELSNIDGSSERDNELATLVIGLSDVTLVNMAMENSTEMKDVLQIVVHAFIRMGEVGKRPVCYFVHQNVNDVSAHDQNIRGRKHLLEQLDEMTRAAAIMEKRDQQFSKFSDVLEYDAVENNWNIPGLWHGNPPMAAVNSSYSHKVLELKKRLFQNLKENTKKRKPSTISEFIQWTKSLWTAVKYENFIFSFRNSLVAEAYKDLSVVYTDVEWDLRKEIHSFLGRAQNRIFNTNQDPGEEAVSLKSELIVFLDEQKRKALQKLKEYYSTGHNTNLVEKYREDFIQSTESLIIERHIYVDRKCDEAVQRRRALQKLNDIKENYKNQIEEEVNKLLQQYSQENKEMDETQLKEVFEKMWQNTISKFKHLPSQKANIMKDMEQSLRQSMLTDTKLLNQKLRNKSLSEMKDEKLQINHNHVESTAFYSRLVSNCIYSIFSSKAQELCDEWVKECKQFVMKKVKQEQDHDSNHCRELLRAIDAKIQKHKDQKFTFTEHFRVDFKLHICGFALNQYEEMHERFRKKNDPLEQLKKEKSAYCQSFMDIYQEKDHTKQKAKMFCENCLIPAIMQAVDNRLGMDIVQHMRQHCKGGKFLYRKNFQVALMLYLKEKDNFDEYYRYLQHSTSFQLDWLKEQVVQHCAATNNNQIPLLCSLALNILHKIVNRLKEALKDITDTIDGSSLADVVQAIKNKLCEEIQITQEKLGPVIFQSEKVNPQDFNQEIASFISTNYLTDRIKDWGKDVAKKITALPSDPADEFYTILCGCGERCPFCGVLCDCTNREHKQHSAEYHWSQGLNGHKHHKTGHLVSENCTTDVAGDSSFRNEDTGGAWFLYKKYRELNKWYGSWNIPPDTSIKTSAFWKWVLYNYNQKFAEKYSAKPAENISSWNISWDTITNDIEDKYKVMINEFY
ncbi:interferon-induced very large GTPase 1-like [Chiloscyllium punctatum]|uniref:interferon-induced very large GTPase 1-like n=1 Tax=Chiloscyllium punctatum TaxID=137246 RepID=UPI003B63518D